MSSIKQFRGEHAFLSNFWVEADGKTAEHRFQAAKTDNPNEREKVLNASTPGQAKGYGRHVTLRQGWDDERLEVMLDVLREKFEDPILRDLLDKTGNASLEEGNYWNDTFWGVSLKTGKGQNHLGQLLEQVREENRFS
jgi:ribA/ribD-fused uncharacterized protein